MFFFFGTLVDRINLKIYRTHFLNLLAKEMEKDKFCWDKI